MGVKLIRDCGAKTLLPTRPAANWAASWRPTHQWLPPALAPPCLVAHESLMSRPSNGRQPGSFRRTCVTVIFPPQWGRGVGRLQSDSRAGEGRWEVAQLWDGTEPTRAAPHTQPLSEPIRAVNSCQRNHTAGATRWEWRDAAHFDRWGGIRLSSLALLVLLPQRSDGNSAKNRQGQSEIGNLFLWVVLFFIVSSWVPDDVLLQLWDTWCNKSLRLVNIRIHLSKTWVCLETKVCIVSQMYCWLLFCISLS